MRTVYNLDCCFHCSSRGCIVAAALIAVAAAVVAATAPSAPASSSEAAAADRDLLISHLHTIGATNDPTQGREVSDEFRIKTIWGELAFTEVDPNLHYAINRWPGIRYFAATTSGYLTSDYSLPPEWHRSHHLHYSDKNSLRFRSH